MPKPEIQLDQLRRLYAAQPVATFLLNHAAKQTNSFLGTSTTVDSLQALINCKDRPTAIRREIVSILRALARAGCGEFFHGRHGQPSRFVWGIPPTALAAAMTDSSATRSVSAATAGGKRSTIPGQSDDSLFSYAFRLRPHLTVSVDLPTDLTPIEAERFARFVQSLPFGEKTASA